MYEFLNSTTFENKIIISGTLIIYGHSTFDKF